MPELPEVETVRSGLAGYLVGARIDLVEIQRESCTRHLPGGSAEFAALTTGATITAVARRGKFMWWELADDDAPLERVVLAHLGMSGQFRVHANPLPPPHQHCRARLHVSGVGETVAVDFIDQRTFGYLHAPTVMPTADGHPGGQGSTRAVVPVSAAHIGRDALDPHLDPVDVVRRWRRSTRGIKQVLLDQTLVSGIGNIYADEALWAAKVHPRQPASTLSMAKAASVLQATQEVMAAALAQGGTSFDALYVNVNGESGYFERGLQAYGRAGAPCTRCGAPIRRAMVHGRSTHWCGQCQRVRSARRVG